MDSSQPVVSDLPQAKIQKHQEFEAEIAAHNSSMTSLKSVGLTMVNQRHFATEQIKVGRAHTRM